MNVSLHARGQLLTRMPAPEAVVLIAELEDTKAPSGSEARIIRRFASKQAADKRWGLSNGGVLVAIIEQGTVVTVYWRREGQPFTIEQFRVDRVRDTTPAEEQAAAKARVESIRDREAQTDINRLRKAWGAR